MAADLGYPTLTGDATLTVNILRNQEPPIFLNEPYSVQVERNQGIGSNIFRVTATDDDLQVCIYVTYGPQLAVLLYHFTLQQNS